MMVMPANASNATVHFLAGKHPGSVGWLIGPSSVKKTKMRRWMPYALDNDAFQSFSKGVEWNEMAWVEMIEWASRQEFKPEWALVPDVVGDKCGTLERWTKYNSIVSGHGFKTAFAVQDGMIESDVPIGVDVLFVGGTTEWKWATVEMWAKRFKRVHVGRVNSVNKLYYLKGLGVESVDGTGWFRDTENGPRVKGLLEFFGEGANCSLFWQ
jgi:hypothetical protein